MVVIEKKKTLQLRTRTSLRILEGANVGVMWWMKPKD